MITKWNLKPLYNSETDPQIQKDIDLSTKNVHTFVKKWKTNKEYTKTPAVLKKAFDDYDFTDDFKIYPRTKKFIPDWLADILKRKRISF
jgi:hypothetical protein